MSIDTDYVSIQSHYGDNEHTKILVDSVLVLTPTY